MLTSVRQFHKVLCKSFADFKERPSEDVRRAIFFPENEDKPRFIWLPVTTIEDYTGKTSPTGSGGVMLDEIGATDFGVPKREVEPGYCMPSSTALFGADTSGPHALVCGKLRSGEALDHSILAFARKSASVPNRCIKKLAKREAEKTRVSKGPVIVFGAQKVVLPKTALDLDTIDLTLAMDAMIGMVPPSEVPDFARKITGVKAYNTTPAFLEEVYVPKRHPIFKSGMPSAISELHGTFLQIWWFPAGGNNDAIPKTAAAASFDPKILHTSLDTTSPDFAAVPESIQDDKRSMLIARPENKVQFPVTIPYLKILAKEFEVVRGHLADPKGGTPEKRLAEQKAKSDEDWVKIRARMMSMGLSDAIFPIQGK